jgi:hypothetical protein
VRKDDQGRVHVTIAPFQDALRGIENQLWEGLDSILDERQRDVARRHLPIAILLRQGRGETTIKIWRDNGKYHYDEFDSGRGVGSGKRD